MLCVAILMLAACDQKTNPTPSSIPATPTGFSVSVGDSQVSLSWNASTELDFKQVNIYQGTTASSLSKVASSATSPFTLTGLNNDQSYFFALEAENTSGETSTRTAVQTATPTASSQTPTLVSSSPESTSSDVALNTNISLTFSESMDEAATQAAVSFAPSIACDFSWNASSTILTCTPSATLSANTLYTASISNAAKSSAGIALTASSFSFTTGSQLLTACLFDSANSTFNACTFGN